MTLPAYYEVQWPSSGFKPDEVNNVTLLGYQVRIRPTLHGYNYIFGDGQSSGMTKDTGGPYPQGNVTHVYPRAGTFANRVDVTYGGEFSVNGAAWTVIPDTVTVTGTTTNLVVRTAKNQLFTQ